MTIPDPTAGTPEQHAFVAALRERFEAEAAQHGQPLPDGFNGWTGSEYNAWLDHRWGWPVTEEGWCAPSWASDDDPEGLFIPHEVDWTECSMCSAIVRQFAEQAQ